jgi:Family of unknown function (DUF6455)
MSDFCLGSATTTRIVARIDLLQRMSVRAGMSPEARQDVEPVSWYEARLRCLGCPFGDRCERALASPRRVREARVPKFCANRDFFSDCGRMQ